MKTMLFKINHFTLALFSIFLLSYTASSQNLSGPLSGALGPGTYYVVGTVYVLANDSLIIEPGTDFLFSGNYDFNIFGKLTAIGTETDSIRFMQNPGSSTWNGIDFYNPTADSSRFEYFVIEGSNCIGMYFDNSSPTFNRCSIRENGSGG